MTWKDISLNKWKVTSLFFGKNKEVLDGELWAISTALKTAKSETKSDFDTPITVFIDSWEAVAPPTQGTWRSNDYVNALRLVDMVDRFFYGVSGTGII